MKRIILSLALIFSIQSVQAKEAALQNLPAQKIACQVSQNSLQFAQTTKRYTLYEQNISGVKALECNKISAAGLVFYTVLLSGEIQEARQNAKVLIYEVVLQKKSGQLTTVRSEIVDEIPLVGEATENSSFTLSVSPQWILSRADNSVLLKISIAAKDEKPDAFYTKFNPKSAWFEDLFLKK